MASVSSSYFYYHYDHFRRNNQLLSLLSVQAAESERRNANKTSLKNQSKQRSKYITDDKDDDDNDNDDDNEDGDDLDRSDESITNVRERRFRDFASVEYNGVVYMTPVDFLESIIAERPRPRIGRRRLTDEIVKTIIYNTPPKHRGSKKFFRTLEEAGIISFTEYLFLWVILTKPRTQFEIAFAMFDRDGNQLVDKHEFLMLGKAMSDKRMLHRATTKPPTGKSVSSEHFNTHLGVEEAQQDTTLIRHFFGKHGRDTLNYAEFKRFMENFQTELLEIEFNEFSHGFKTISELDFAEILLRYTNLDRDAKKTVLKKIKKSSNTPNAITFEQFQNFFAFLNNLDEFNIAMRFHQLSNKPISQAEFQRAVRLSTGFELEPHIVALIFRIFDADDDQHLSYDEFMAVMKGRLSRGFQTDDSYNTLGSKFDQFKRCLRDRAKSTIHDAEHWFDSWKT